MKKYCIVFVSVLLVFLASCSQVFEAGVSGKVVCTSSGSERGAGGISVFAYSDKAAYTRDLEKFISGEIKNPSAGYVPRTVTAEDGSFTITKIVWETKKSQFGKTADVSNLYLIFYHEDYEPCGFGPVSIISGSTNASAIKQEVEQVLFPMPVFSSQIDLVSPTNIQDTNDSNDFDNVKLILTDESFNTYKGTGFYTYTTSREHVAGDTRTYSHGHFANLGAGLKYRGDAVIVNIVWDANENGQADSGEYYYPCSVTKTTSAFPQKITFKKQVEL